MRFKKGFQKRQQLSRGLKDVEKAVRQTSLYPLGSSLNSASFVGVSFQVLLLRARIPVSQALLAAPPIESWT